MSDLGYYWRNRERLLAAQKAYYHNLPETKRRQANAASNAKKKQTERLLQSARRK